MLRCFSTRLTSTRGGAEHYLPEGKLSRALSYLQSALSEEVQQAAAQNGLSFLPIRGVSLPTWAMTDKRHVPLSEGLSFRFPRYPFGYFVGRGVGDVLVQG